MKSYYNFTVKHSNGENFDMHDLNIWIESFRIYSPNAIREFLEPPSQNGARLKKSKIGVRRVRIVFQVESDSILDYDNIKHKIYRIFYTDEPFEIVRDITPEKKIFVIHEGDYDIENISPTDGEFELFLTMLDPYLIGPSHNITIGSTFQVFTIQGQQRTPWKSTTIFSEAINTFELKTNNGGNLVFNFDFINGDVLEIDYQSRKIWLNGERKDVGLSLDSIWFDLTPGLVELKASYETTITYFERYY
jgi:Phage tail protein